MPKTVTVCVDDKDVEITMRRVKKKELKTLAEKLAGKLEAISGFFGGSELIKAAPAFLDENIDFICSELILPFATLTPEQIDEMSIADIAALLREMLSYNGLDTEKLSAFFKTAGQTGLFAERAAQAPREESFAGVQIPS